MQHFFKKSYRILDSSPGRTGKTKRKDLFMNSLTHNLNHWTKIRND